MAQSQQSAIPDPEVIQKPTRRIFDDPYKIKILEEIDQAKERGQIGAILRREGLYYSQLTSWRKQRENGELKLPQNKRQTPKNKDPLHKKVHSLENENRNLRKKLEQAQALIEVQKKFPI